MDDQKKNLEFVRLLNEWDPFNIGEGNYDTEVADSVQALFLIDDEDALARKIQAIYDFSFEELIPMEKCLQIAKRLLDVKDNDSCSI
ncbi:DUF1871 family protein [Bacillus sp. B1-b2]|uniref:DUF1871 family protein n=1 Tax=Bacillus sp. B1-b2 TaxID=2653201 RepID=UPI001261C13E|nr:DUF1871 family protein [Bacillus sp. B1-b2]KAB7666461.1 DUF1871 family protein [Bacillus sp. B1-b2]